MGPRSATNDIQRHTVLLVDDADEIREAIGRILGGAGFDVTTALGGEDALRLFREGLRPAIVLLDLMMPDMTGYEVLAQMREEPALVDIPVIVVSAYENQRRFALRVGAVAFFEKPLDFDALIATVEKYC